MRSLSVLVALFAMTCLGLASAAEAKQLALVVGNDAYQEVPALTAGVNDARAMSAALAKAGFTVELVENGTKRQISRALAKVEGSIAPGDTVLFHYSGHGFEIDGQNWLLPVDIPSAKDGEADLIKDESFNAADIIDRFRSRGAGTVVAFIDACRDNPFAAGGTRSLGGTRGLARMDPSGGVFIMFSAGAKQEALDRLAADDKEPTSVFVRSIVPLIGRQDLSLVDMAKQVQGRVRELARSVGHDQVPAYYDGIVERVGLSGAVPTSLEPVPVAAPPPSRANNASEDVFWQSIETSRDPAMFQAYLDQVHAGSFAGTYAALAKIRLAALAPPAGTPMPPPVKLAALPAPVAPVPVPASPLAACDGAAADATDPDRPSTVVVAKLDRTSAGTAIAACLGAAQLQGAPRRVFYELGRAYDVSGDDADAVKLYQKAADLGHLAALQALAEHYISGRGIAHDGQAAKTLLVKAADAGLPGALVRLGQVYAGGLLGKPDYITARSFFQLAMTAQVPASFAEMGQLYFSGEGVPVDKDHACRLFKRGAAAGDPAAADKQRSICGVP